MSERGFSLLETMVALVVFSIAAMGLISLNSQSVRLSGDLELRQLAGIVAENVAVDTVTSGLQTKLGTVNGNEVQRRRDFSWSRTIEPTPREGLYSVRIDVMLSGRPGTLARISLLATESRSE